MIESLLLRASSLARLLGRPLGSYIRRQTWVIKKHWIY